MAPPQPEVPQQQPAAFPEVYTKAPELPEPRVAKPGYMTKEQLDHFFREGYVVLENFIDTKMLEQVKKELEDQVEDIANKLVAAGKIKNKHSDKDLWTRMIHLNKEFPGVSILHHKSDEMAPTIRELWHDEKLLDAVEQIVGTISRVFFIVQNEITINYAGPNIAGHPIWNLRIKLPRNEPELVPWHQDNAYMNDDAFGTMICTAWIPLLDTDRSNGGMAVVKRTHQSGVVGKHFQLIIVLVTDIYIGSGDHHCCSGGTWYIEIDDDVIEKTFDCKMSQDEVECKVPFGGVLLFSNAIVHCSYPNTSDHIRWSMDLRWQVWFKSGNSLTGCSILNRQDPELPNGRPEPNEVMPIFRKNGEHINNVDWSVMIDRHRNDVTMFNDEAKGEVEDEFDTRISGPWMMRWPIKHHNRHTEQAGIFPKSSTAKEK